MSFKVSAQTLDKHPLRTALQTLQPKLNNEEALILSNLIYKYSIKYNVDPYRVIAIGMQESGLKNIDRLSKNGIITDIGIFQFNVGTIDIYKLDSRRLKDDISYAVEKACWLLSKKLKDCQHLGKDAWGCFHSRSDKHRLKYHKMVDKYYKLIKSEE